MTDAEASNTDEEVGAGVSTETGEQVTESPVADQVWSDVLDRIKSQAGSQELRGIQTWLCSPKVRCVVDDGGSFAIECMSVMFVNLIRERYRDRLHTAFHDITGREGIELDVRIWREAFREHEHAKLISEKQGASTATAARPTTSAARQQQRRWGLGFKRLSDFVVGTCNRLAYDAVSTILEDPDHPVNPLFIHASSGLGKTHLIQGLAMSYRERYPTSAVNYLRCEQFTNDFINASKSVDMLKKFRIRMRHIDLLLMDDIHFLSKSTMHKTKQELFETFDELAQNGKKVVITSDAAPSDIRYLEDRFVQRFAGGLVVPLDRPDLRVRQGIVRAKSESQSVEFPQEVVDFIADHITDNIRELEGAVNKIVAYARSFDRRPDLALARHALHDIIGRDAGEPRLKVILRAVADHFDLTTEEVLGKGRSGPRSLARHISMYVYKASSAETYQAVGQAFGGKSHSTVTYACEQVAKLRAQDPQLDRFVDDLLMRVRRR